MKQCLEQLKNSNDFDSSIVASKVLYYICYTGVDKDYTSNETECFRSSTYINKYALRLQDEGGLEILEDMQMHPNQELRYHVNQIVDGFFGTVEEVEQLILESNEPLELEIANIKSEEATLFTNKY
jgi:hypothetical protein